MLLDLKPTGEHYMEDFPAAGGMATLLRALKPLLHLDALTVTGRTLGEELEAQGPGFAQNVVRPLSDPIHPQGSVAVLYGNLAPGGAIVKQSAADPRLMEHEGRAVVFEDAADLAARIDDPALDVTADDVMVLKRIGPKGHPGMPEAGYLPIPTKLARQGVKDMLRISDGRMSGTAFGSIVLHVTPEAAIGGPLAWVRNGDRIRISLSRRELTLLVDEAEMAARRDAQPVAPRRQSAATESCSWTPCCRQTAAWTSTSWSRRRCGARCRRPEPVWLAPCAITAGTALPPVLRRLRARGQCQVRSG